MPPDDTPKIVALLMKWFHLEQRQAEYTLLGFVVVAILISLFLFFNGSNTVAPINSITTEDVLPR